MPDFLVRVQCIKTVAVTIYGVMGPGFAAAAALDMAQDWQFDPESQDLSIESVEPIKDSQ